VLRGIPQDEIDRMSALAELFGGPALSRAADIVNTALTGMTGTTPPRIHLELMVARLLTELSDGRAETHTVATPVAAAPVVAAPVVAPVAAPVIAHVAADPTPTNVVVAAGSLAELLEVWPAILEELQSSKGSWVVINSARPASLEGDVLTLEFADPLWVQRFKEKPASGPAVYEDLREAIVGALGVRLRFVPRAGLAGVVSTPPDSSTPAAPSAATPPAPVESATQAPPVPDNTIADDAPTTKMQPVSPAAGSDSTPESTAQSGPNPDDEQRGESVVRDILGAKLIATIDDAATPLSRSASADDGPAIFDVEPAPEKD
jgi:DNA polymerase-3 subunit gamma/tau